MSEQYSPMPSPQTSPFDSIRHSDEGGDYWTARELMPLLEYSSWQKFEEAIQRAMTDCAKSGREVADNFTLEVKNKVGASEMRGRKAKDYRLSRYACRLIAMNAQTLGTAAAQARTYFSDRVDEAEQFLDPDQAFLEWRRRAIASYMAHGYSQEWAERRVDDITARNALTHEWHVRGITQKEFPILTDRLHMRSFGLATANHKELKGFEVTYRGKKPIYADDLPPAMTATELALNSLASTVARELYVSNDSQGFKQIASDVDTAGRIVGDTRRQIEAATGRPVVSPRNMLKEPAVSGASCRQTTMVR